MPSQKRVAQINRAKDVAAANAKMAKRAAAAKPASIVVQFEEGDYLGHTAYVWTAWKRPNGTSPMVQPALQFVA